MFEKMPMRDQKIKNSAKTLAERSTDANKTQKERVFVDVLRSSKMGYIISSTSLTVTDSSALDIVHVHLVSSYSNLEYSSSSFDVSAQNEGPEELFELQPNMTEVRKTDETNIFEVIVFDPGGYCDVSLESHALNEGIVIIDLEGKIKFMEGVLIRTPSIASAQGLRTEKAREKGGKQRPSGQLETIHNNLSTASTSSSYKYSVHLSFVGVD